MFGKKEKNRVMNFLLNIECRTERYSHFTAKSRTGSRENGFPVHFSAILPEKIPFFENFILTKGKKSV